MTKPIAEIRLNYFEIGNTILQLDLYDNGQY